MRHTGRHSYKITIEKRCVSLIDTFLATLAPMLVMLACMLIGFVLRKSKIIPENSASVLSKLEVYVFLPAQILHTFITNCTVASISEQYPVILCGVLVTAIAVLVGVLISRLFSKDEDERRIYQYALTFANNGFLGMSIVPLILGEMGMYTYMLFMLPVNVALYGWGVNTLVPAAYRKKQSVWKQILNPTIVAMACGIALGLLGANNWLPEFMMTATKNLAGCMGPIAMVLTGFIIGGYHIPSLLKNKRVYIATALRLLLLPMLLVGVLWCVGADVLTMKVTMFAFATALGLNTVVIPAAYDADTTTGASMALISHVLCIVTIPVLYVILEQIAK